MIVPQVLSGVLLGALLLSGCSLGGGDAGSSESAAGGASVDESGDRARPAQGAAVAPCEDSGQDLGHVHGDLRGGDGCSGVSGCR